MKRSWATILIAGAASWAVHSSPGSGADSPPLGSDGGCVNLTLSGATLIDAGTCSNYNPLRDVYWGDLHDHSYFSLDAYGFGNRRPPYLAYQFAMGVCSTLLGQPVQIDRPLDFVVVSDHSEYLGATDECFNLDDGGWTDYDAGYCVGMRAVASTVPANLVAPYFGAVACPLGDDGGCIVPREPIIEKNDPAVYASATQSVWQREVGTANEINDSHLCKFTTLPAYEWTASPNGNTMHHIVVFANATVPPAPLDYIHYDSEYALLTNLSAQCTGNCDVITIQHNSNLSGGVAWNTLTTPVFENLRSRYEKLVEMHQTKGNSECVYDSADSFGYNDPLCNFEYRTNDVTLADGGVTGQGASTVARGYVRPGLGLGIADWANNRRNAHQFGFVGATDNHQSTPGNVRESTWNGSIAASDNQPDHRLEVDQKVWNTVNPGGVTGVWAEQNLRPSIFGALKRREAFASSGPRIPVRFYQTWDQTTDYCADPGFPALIVQNIALNGGAIMGSTIVTKSPPPGARPRFVVFALRDPLDDPTYSAPADLQEEQLIKGVYDPVSGKTTVTIQSQTVQTPPLPNETGSSFCHTFTDATWDQTKAAYYYPRVLQMPTWRWSHYDCQTSKGAPVCNKAQQDVQIQERAWGSPVWYLP